MKPKLEIKNIKVIQAPLAGISDIVYRNEVRKYSKNCLLTTEMLSAEALNNCPKPKSSILDFNEAEYPLVFQLVGHKPKMIAKCAKLLEERASAIELNFGCPVLKVVRSNDGSAMMKTPGLAAEIISEVKNVISIPVSAKFRLGWSSENENFIEFGKSLESAGVDYVTIHGRTRTQMYSGIADWEKIGQLKRELNTPVFANGDIKSVEDAIKCLKVTNADGVSIGRGVIGDFTLPARIEHYLKTGEIIKTPDLSQKIEMLKVHLNEEIKLRGERIAIPYMRKFYGFYIADIKNASKYRQVLVQLQTQKEVIEVLDDILCLSFAN